ncbi:MAG: hypothetical protein LBI63_05995 [Candidatus Ancillula sp.]|jgi:hypothetical protein|nr:hypothetical protein [Candidatus Ancillula sp.]
MRIKGTRLSVVNNGDLRLFNDISFSFSMGELTVVATDSTQKATTFSMLASGRLRKYQGTLSIVSSEGKKRPNFFLDASIDKSTLSVVPSESKKHQSLFDLHKIRSMTAVVFTPIIDEPDEFLKAWQIISEEFTFAGKNSSRQYALDYLEQEISEDIGNPKLVRIKDLDSIDRIKIFTKLAAARPGVKFIFITMPERYGGLPNRWFKEIQAVQTENNSVILITTKIVAKLLKRPYYDLDNGMKLCSKIKSKSGT